MIIYCLLCVIEALRFGIYKGCGGGMFAPCVWGVTLTRRILFQRSELRFRRTDVEEISLRRLIGIAKFFDVAGDFKNLFTKREYFSIEEVISEHKPRKRVSRKWYWISGIRYSKNLQKISRFIQKTWNYLRKICFYFFYKGDVTCISTKTRAGLNLFGMWRIFNLRFRATVFA